MSEKEKKLEGIIKDFGKLAVAFSGGVDSTYLLYIASKVLKDDCIAISANLFSGTKEEKERSSGFCSTNNIRHISLDINELKIKGFADNPPDRCYICKSSIFNEIKEAAKKEGIDIVADGSNLDDESDYRPGMRAIKELDIKSPLIMAGLTKEDIRALSKEKGLSTWDMPSAPCLSSRIPYGEKITLKKLSMIEESESFLRSLGFKNCRVRTHESLARIEVDETDFEKMLENKTRKLIIEKLKETGYTFVSLDLSGFRSGSLNDLL